MQRMLKSNGLGMVVALHKFATLGIGRDVAAQESEASVSQSIHQVIARSCVEKGHARSWSV